MTEPQNVSGLMDQIHDLKRQIADAERRGAVKALREQAERAEHDYLEFVNALQGCRGDADYWRWNGHAEALRAVATRLRELAGDGVPACGRTAKTGGRDLDGRTWDEYPAGAA